MPTQPRVIYWFRTDLRLHDSPALTAALDLNPELLYPIWTWDPHYVYRARVGGNRWQFLIDCQNDLSQSLTRLNQKQKLLVVREAPQTVLPKLFKVWGITHLVFEKDTDAYARSRDEEVIQLAGEAGVEVVVKMGRTLYDPDVLVEKNGGKPTMSMSQVQHYAWQAASSLGDPAKPLPAPTSMPDPGPTDLSSIDQSIPSPKPDVNSIHRKTGPETSYTSITGPNHDFAVPTLTELGIPPATTPHRGGETLALQSLETICSNEKYVYTFEKPKTAPTAFEPQATTLLSPHLHFGSLSVREFYWRVDTVISKAKKEGKTTSKIPENLPGQLLFRDMYFGAQAALGYSFAQCEGNKVCRFVDWHLPSNVSSSPVGEHLLTGTYQIDSTEAETWFRRWKYGQTGFPFVDALMRQLRQEGWIHHLGRHMVACFLTRGGCYVHWERGAEVFEEWLIDHETACNSGNWMWLSCTAFYSMFYRCYSPVAFGRKWDPEGAFVKKYVPELAEFDKKYIYEPWKAPVKDQKEWGCRVEAEGETVNEGDETEPVRTEDGLMRYPKPMFDFNERRDLCMDKIKKAYAVKMYGDDEKVKNGEWKKVFGFEVEEGAGQTMDEENGEVDGRIEKKGGNRKRGVNGNGHANGAEDDAGGDNHEDETAKTPRSRTRGTRKRGQTTLDGRFKKKTRR